MTTERVTGNRQQATGNGGIRKGSDMADRLLALAAAAVRLVGTLPKDVAGRHIGSQLIRCATSGGANYEEARAAESPADFIHKVSVSAKEIRETTYWLKLIRTSSMTSSNVESLISEANELAAILVASGRTARKNVQG